MGITNTEDYARIDSLGKHARKLATQAKDKRLIRNMGPPLHYTALFTV